MNKKITALPSRVDVGIFQLHRLWKCSISIGEEYYETDFYKDKECAIAELKGWWDGRNILTGEVEHFEPKTYGKGGWSLPDVKIWLDCKMPYKEGGEE